MITYFADSMLERRPLLLRRVEDDGGITDEAYVGGAWGPTTLIVDYMFGHNDYADEISEAEARRLEPSAI